jgi:hypothetical protein
VSNIVAPTASALRPGHRLVNSLTLVMTTLLAFIISFFATLLRVDVSWFWLGRFIDVGVPLLLAAYFAYVTMIQDLRALDGAHELSSLWRAHFNRAVLIYPPLAWVIYEFTRCPCYPDLVILGAVLLLTLAGTLLGTYAAMGAFRLRQRR